MCNKEKENESENKKMWTFIFLDRIYFSRMPRKFFIFSKTDVSNTKVATQFVTEFQHEMHTHPVYCAASETMPCAFCIEK